MSATELHPVDTKLAPLLLAIGRAVLGAAALEKVLLVDIAQRRAANGGLTQRLGLALSHLEQQPAGALLRTLRELGISDEVATRIQDVILRRNELVHRFMEDSDVARVFATQEGVEAIVARVDRLAADTQRVINEVGTVAFPGAQQILGTTFVELLEYFKAADVDAVDDDRLRTLIHVARSIDGDELSALFPPPQ